MIHRRDELPVAPSDTESVNAVWALLSTLPHKQQLRECRKNQGNYAYDNWRFMMQTRLLPCDCIVWKNVSSRNGYGLFSILGKKHQAHRVAYIWENGDIPRGHFIDHLCANKRCVAVEHLEAVTPRENTKRSNLPLAGAPACRYSHAIQHARHRCEECGGPRRVRRKRRCHE